MPSWAHVSGMHGVPPPHWPEVPPPPQVCGGVQGPHWMTLPQPSPAGPHEIPSAMHVSGTQPVLPPHWPETPPPPHVCGGVQVPQLATTLPHPSLAGPQVMLDGHGCGVHMPDGGVPHWPETPPPPHVCGGVQGVQSAVSPPHPSLCWPHVPVG